VDLLDRNLFRFCKEFSDRLKNLQLLFYYQKQMCHFFEKKNEDVLYKPRWRILGTSSKIWEESTSALLKILRPFVIASSCSHCDSDTFLCLLKRKRIITRNSTKYEKPIKGSRPPIQLFGVFYPHAIYFTLAKYLVFDWSRWRPTQKIKDLFRVAHAQCKIKAKRYLVIGWDTDSRK